MKKPLIHQIFYSEETRQIIQPDFFPIDNTNSAHPEWFEFWVMLNYLRENRLEDEKLYGFLSPKFTEKTGLTSKDLFELIDKSAEDIDVFLLSPHGWDQICFYQNSWEQGEVWHPGLINFAQSVFDKCQIIYETKKSVADTYCSVFSNYFIANKKFWNEWLEIAERIFLYINNNKVLDNKKTTYGYGITTAQYPMKAFIQERIAEIVLIKNNFKVVRTGDYLINPIFETIFEDSMQNRLLLNKCDEYKHKFRMTEQSEYIDLYWKTRREIKYFPPNIKPMKNIMKIQYSKDFFKKN
jgi:hypothetical protein